MISRPPEAISLQAKKGSNEYVVAVLKKFYPGSWLPYGVEQIVSCAGPDLRLISAKNGRLDYIETMNQWGRTWRFSPRKLLPGFKSLRYFLLDPAFRYKVETLVRNYNQECFKREIMDHQRMVFEKI